MRDSAPDQQTTELRHLGSLLARAFVIAGGVFWGIAAFAGPFVYQDMSVVESIKIAMWPFLAAIVILIIGWYYERLAGILLFGAAAAVPVWGVLYGWEIGIWFIMTAVLIVPMLVAASLFMFSGRGQLEGFTAEEPECADAVSVDPRCAPVRIRTR